MKKKQDIHLQRHLQCLLLNAKTKIKIFRENSVISMLYTYLDLNLEAIKKAENSRLADGIDIRLVNLGSIALFSKYRLTTSFSKHWEDISRVLTVSLW